jgi:hypothetical protein
MDRLPGFYKSLLRKVRGIILIPYHAVDHSEDLGSVFGYQCAKGRYKAVLVENREFGSGEFITQADLNHAVILDNMNK